MSHFARSPRVREGEILSGKFRVERVLGEGGMGVVVAAHHLQLDQRVALKFMLPEAMVSHETTERFLREARAVARLRSENTVRVLDVGTLDNQAPYIVMELLDGTDVAALVEKSPLPIGQAVGIVLQTCAAVAEAHAHGIVHRDLKPRNLFLTEDLEGKPLVKVLDFGISKDLGDSEARDKPQLTGTRMMLGSPQYMSPEQLKSSRDVDTRADVWSLGICLYELLTQQVPFSAASIAELCVVVLSEEPKSVRELRADVPPELDAVIQRCLKKPLHERFQSVAELAAALEPFADPWAKPAAERARNVMRSSRSTGSVVSPPAASSGTLATGPTVATWDVEPTRRRSRPLLIVPFALAAVVAVGSLVFALARHGHDESKAAQRTPAPPPPTAIASSPPPNAVAPPPSESTAVSAPVPAASNRTAPPQTASARTPVHYRPPVSSVRPPATASHGSSEDRLLLDRN